MSTRRKVEPIDPGVSGPNSSRASCAAESQWWAGTHFAVKRRGTRMYNGPWIGEITRMYNGPQVGEITLDEDASRLRSEQALSELGAWAAEHLGTSR